MPARRCRQPSGPTTRRSNGARRSKQGDVYEAALGRPAIIGIIDGYFEVTPTVWHKEILWAMAQGIHVYGSASIGALRAAELHTFGMVGIGRIFEAYRDGILTDDDEVAVLHGPEELGYPVVTEAMVNILAPRSRGGWREAFSTADCHPSRRNRQSALL